jgi:hypothetical protein
VPVDASVPASATVELEALELDIDVLDAVWVRLVVPPPDPPLASLLLLQAATAAITIAMAHETLTIDFMIPHSTW